MNRRKRGFVSLILLLVLVLAFAGCSRNKDTASIFPNIPDADLPEVLLKTVGTVGSTSYSSFDKPSAQGYRAVLTVTFDNTTKDDYTTLMTHYEADATGTDQDGYLLFDWGRLQVTPDDSTITITALID